MSEPLILITIQSLKLLVAARYVREVLGEREWIPIPGTRQEIPGVVGWGRRAVAMLDLARVVPEALAIKIGEKRPRMLMLQVADSHLAVPADSVSSIVDVADMDIRPRALSSFPLCRSEVHLNGQVLPLFDPMLLLEQTGVK